MEPWQRYSVFAPPLIFRLGGRSVGIGVAQYAFRVPFVFGRSEREASHRTGEMPVASGPWIV